MQPGMDNLAEMFQRESLFSACLGDPDPDDISLANVLDPSVAVDEVM